MYFLNKFVYTFFVCRYADFARIILNLITKSLNRGDVCYILYFDLQVSVSILVGLKYGSKLLH